MEEREETKVYKFPSIEQFRNVIQQVSHRARYVGSDEHGDPIYDQTIPLPTLNFVGSVKLHGSNGGIVFIRNNDTYEVQVQSRERILTVQSDNARFAAFVHMLDKDVLLKQILKFHPEPEVIRVYGEWCGKKIQKGVAVTQLERMYVIFGVKVDHQWLTEDQLKEVKIPEQRVFNICDFEKYSISIDFNDPKEAVEKMTQMVNDVETVCPVGKHFGVEGTGEGIVWKCIDNGWTESKFWFKTKGEKHKISKTKETIAIDIERVNSVNELVNSFLTEARLEQGLGFLEEHKHEMSRKSTGHYVKWVADDVVKEELDTILGNGFHVSEITKSVANIARAWFFKKLDEGIGL